MAGCPDDLPITLEAHPSLFEYKDQLEFVNSPLAQLFKRVMSEQGQAYLDTAIRVFEKPSTQDVVTNSIDFVHSYFSAIREFQPDMLLEELQQEAATYVEQDADALQLLAINSEWKKLIIAIRILSGISYGVVRPVLCDCTAMGSLMRRKLEPMLMPIVEQMKTLRGLV